MNWQPGTSRYYEQADSYRVSAARIGRRWRFSAWHKSAAGWERLGTWDTADAAKAACERHREGVHERSAGN